MEFYRYDTSVSCVTWVTNEIDYLWEKILRQAEFKNLKLQTAALRLVHSKIIAFGATNEV
jgi:hypothetical protein